MSSRCAAVTMAAMKAMKTIKKVGRSRRIGAAAMKHKIDKKDASAASSAPTKAALS